jgi:hypothetical protein
MACFPTGPAGRVPIVRRSGHEHLRQHAGSGCRSGLAHAVFDMFFRRLFGDVEDERTWTRSRHKAARRPSGSSVPMIRVRSSPAASGNPNSFSRMARSAGPVTRAIGPCSQFLACVFLVRSAVIFSLERYALGVLSHMGLYKNQFPSKIMANCYIDQRSDRSNDLISKCIVWACGRLWLDMGKVLPVDCDGRGRLFIVEERRGSLDPPSLVIFDLDE